MFRNIKNIKEPKNNFKGVLFSFSFQKLLKVLTLYKTKPPIQEELFIIIRIKIIDINQDQNEYIPSKDENKSTIIK